METALQRRLAAVEGARVETAVAAVRVPSAATAVAVIGVLAETQTRFRAVYGVVPQEAAAEGAVTVVLGGLDTVEVDAASHTLRAGGGARFTAVQAAAEAASLAVVGSDGGHHHRGDVVGDLIGAGGLAARALTGIEAVLATGETVRCGGRMAKDVAPYSVAAALLGSRGRLAVVLAVTLRLAPPGAAAVGGHAGAGGGRPATAVDEAVRRAFDPDGLLVGA